MKVGLGSYALAWAIGAPGYLPKKPMDVFGFIDCAAEHGFKLVQIADNLPLHDLSEGELKRLKTLAQSLEIEVEVGTRGIANGNLERYLDLAQFFDSPLLRVVVDSDGHHPDPDEVTQVIVKVLPKFENAGVTLAIENHDRFKARDLLEILRDLNSDYVGICLDTVNSLGALEGLEVVLDTLAPHVVNVHIKDFAIKRESHNMGFRIFGTPAGQGVLDIPWLMERLDMRERGLNAILELWPAPEGNLEETIAKEAEWVGESAQFLFNSENTNQRSSQS